MANGNAVYCGGLRHSPNAHKYLIHDLHVTTTKHEIQRCFLMQS